MEILMLKESVIVFPKQLGILMNYRPLTCAVFWERIPNSSH